MKENQKLYRFIPFHELVDICERPGKLVLKSPRLWDDNYEGYFYRKLMNEKSMSEVFNKLKSLIKPSDLDLHAIGKNGDFNINILSSNEKTVLAMLRYSAIYYMIFGVCWSKKKESDALWRIYSYENQSLRISTKKIYFNKCENLFIDEVKYDKRFDMEKAFDEVIFRDNKSKKISIKFLKPFFIKRKEFEHEKEVRMLYFDELPQLLIFNLFHTENPRGFKWNEITKKISACCDKDGVFLTLKYKKLLEKYLSQFKEENKVKIDINIEGLDKKNIIDDVMVHPLAPDYYVKIVEKYCKRLGVKFLGKSKLYIFE